ncbi:hypothetical protein ERX46_15105 [Brumimicrobium glaciale]|jgi:hypothetical protein|uniref:DUF5362 domain-containing protein n=1 Tax=Brumimicrobium glaciale TaxID=200475 RepID=A0A4Q4KII4_9FLAO|nr:hypothetical protein [Brumimicrobium glaciale]RYM32590.1 hypothetical protein ERX46_15105 [Brumimicrobium glaciale]
MENLDEYNQDNELINNGNLSPTAKENLHNSAVWVKIIAIVGIVGSGIGAIFSLILIFTSPATVIFNLAFYALFIYVSMLLLNVSKSIERGSLNMDAFAENFLKYYKIIAIMTIVGIVLSIFAVIFAASFATSMINGF